MNLLNERINNVIIALMVLLLFVGVIFSFLGAAVYLTIVMGFFYLVIVPINHIYSKKNGINFYESKWFLSIGKFFIFLVQLIEKKYGSSWSTFFVISIVILWNITLYWGLAIISKSTGLIGFLSLLTFLLWSLFSLMIEDGKQRDKRKKY